MSENKNISKKNRNRSVDDPKQVELSKAEARVAEKEIARDMHYLLAIPEFTRFCLRVMQYCEIWEDPFTGNSSTFHNCGRQEVGKWLQKEIERYSPRALLKVMEERVKEIEKQQLKEMEK